jgi:pimeloyl-ACP methyl ester carboxylesterase
MNRRSILSLVFLMSLAGPAYGTEPVISESTVTVPERRSGTPAGSIELAVVRVGRSAKPSASAHIILAGGPGDSGVKLVQGLARHGGAMLLELFDGDIIGIDQRGTGKSVPSLEVSRSYRLPLDKPGSPEAWLPSIDEGSRSVAADMKKRGIRIEAYNTEESADDIEAVRRALGYKAMTVWGRSYGSHLALSFLRRHPKSALRVILANPEGPDHTLKLPSRVDAVLERLEQRVSLDPQMGLRVPSLRALMRNVLDQLEREPVFVEVPHPETNTPVRVGVSRFDIQLLTARALSSSRSIGSIPALYLEMATGDFRRAAQLVLAYRMRMGVESAMKQMMDLSSGATAARRKRIQAESAQSLLGNAINFPLMSLGAAWGGPDLGDSFRRPVRSNVPVLILAGDLDPRTPIENAHEIAASLGKAQVVEIVNGTHDFDLFSSPKILEVLAAFLRARPLPAHKLELAPLVFTQRRPI